MSLLPDEKITDQDETNLEILRMVSTPIEDILLEFVPLLFDVTNIQSEDLYNESGSFLFPEVTLSLLHQSQSLRKQTRRLTKKLLLGDHVYLMDAGTVIFLYFGKYPCHFLPFYQPSLLERNEKTNWKSHS